jgi:lipid II:glycine glycyltransferase (peptidoglycan interpeptide bridge formation enzyme)
MDVTLSRKNRRLLRSTPVLQQTSFWSEVKERQGIHSLAVSLNVPAEELGLGGEVSGPQVSEDILILFQVIGDNFCIGYIPYGPKIQPADDAFGIFLEELSESLRPFLPHKCIMLRYDLRWRSLWDENDTSYDENGIWEGPPPKRNQELRMNISTENWNLRKAGTDVLPSDTVFLDLRQDEDQLLAAMKPKTRYNMRLSRRRGVKVRSADTGELDTWYRLYRETCRRNGIHLHSSDYFRAVAEADKARISTTGEVDLLIAEAEGVPLAAMFLAYSSSRATYLFGASADRKGNHMPAYALQWEAIRRARLKGCTEYDMFGVSPTANPSHPLYGLYRFKTGFGGTLFHRMGCWDYPLDRDMYNHYAAAEMNGGGYHVH